MTLWNAMSDPNFHTFAFGPSKKMPDAWVVKDKTGETVYVAKTPDGQELVTEYVKDRLTAILSALEGATVLPFAQSPSTGTAPVDAKPELLGSGSPPGQSTSTTKKLAQDFYSEDTIFYDEKEQRGMEKEWPEEETEESVALQAKLDKAKAEGNLYEVWKLTGIQDFINLVTPAVQKWWDKTMPGATVDEATSMASWVFGTSLAASSASIATMANQNRRDVNSVLFPKIVSELVRDFDTDAKREGLLVQILGPDVINSNTCKTLRAKLEEDFDDK